MSGRTELLLCCVLLSWSPVSCRPVPTGAPQLDLSPIQFTFRSLQTAEHDYVACVFGGDPPEGYRDQSWALVKGISLSTNSRDIAESSCSIAQYLEHPLPSIVRVSTQNHRPIIQNVTEFNYAFKQALNASQAEACQRRRFTVPRNKYQKKVMGLRILYSAREWLTRVTGTAEFS